MAEALRAEDELRHPANDHPSWRESVYFNFADPVHRIGAWIYLWVLPNQRTRSGMLCSFYHGFHPEEGAPARAQSQPGHLERWSDGSWLYFRTVNGPELPTADFDDIALSGLRLVRKRPLEGYRLTFDDGAGNGFDFDGTFLMPPYNYAEHPHPTPPWMAANRYHRSWRCEGSLRIGGETYEISTTGDSDHSWGLRERGEIEKNLFKMWSAQVGDALSFSVLTMGPSGQEVPHGFINRGGEIRPILRFRESTVFGDDGIERSGSIALTDDAGQSIEATFEMFASIPIGGGPASWGHEGAATFDVAGAGTGSGIASYFWPRSLAAGDLARGIRP